MSRVLIVDDEKTIRDTLAYIIESLGHEAYEASDGDEALKILSEKDIDLVVSDLIMPNREGLQTIQEIKNNWPDVKIIAMSGGGRAGTTDYLDYAQTLGADLTLKKPFSMAALKSTVIAVLSQDLSRD